MAGDTEIERDIDELCKLAFLYLNAVEKMQIARELDTLLKELSQIWEVDTHGVEPVLSPTVQPGLSREDKVEPSLDPGRVFENTVNRSDRYFRVPCIYKDKPGDA